MQRKSWLTVGLVFVCILGLTVSAWSQCAMCRTGLTQSPEGQKMARGLNQAILFLLTAPYLLVSTVALQILRLQARARGTTVRQLLGISGSRRGRRRLSDSPVADDSAGRL
ncbi:MAG: hypothetical protein NZ742_02715 [Acidobacteria bacterium]|nr:hypothetical protein [Acidobacteriota bacterium]MDW7983860.1 hypothetical protein [Acidobacteriota bacterium]